MSNHFISTKLIQSPNNQFKSIVPLKFQLVTSISSNESLGYHQILHTIFVKYAGIFHHLIDITFNNGVLYTKLHIPGFFERSQLSKFKSSKLLQPENIIAILVTLLVFQLLKSNPVKLLQFWNIALILVTLLVFQFTISISTKSCIP